MSTLTYALIRGIGTPAFWVSSRPVILHRDRIPRRGPAILAPTHLSHYDVPCLMATVWRHIDFLSVVEFERTPLVGTLFRGMNCVFLDRGRVDPAAVRETLRRLAAGRLVAMFPEGRIRDWPDSAVHGKPFKPGVGRLAQMSGAPVVPCVVLGTDAYKRPDAWAPLRRVRFGINFGDPLTVRPDLPPDAGQADLVDRLSRAYGELYRELRPRLPAGVVPPDPATGASA
jgi:1-acyl-sn-glycerol-3-phosphate acyltransferase